MNRKTTILSCIFFSAVQSFTTFAQWVNCPNTTSLHGYSLASRGSEIWLGNQGDIRKSTDNGASFIQSNDGIPNSSQISEIFIADNAIFARKNSSFDPLYRSIDNGTNWELKNEGLSWTEPLPWLLSNITQIGSTLYIGTSNGVYHSTDNGESWSEIAGNNWSTLGLTGKYVRVVKNNGGKLYAGTGEGLFISSDNGVTWSAGGVISMINDIVFNGNDVFVCTNNGGEIFKSTDDGLTFTFTENTLPCNLVRKMVAIEGKILAAADQGFLVYDIESEEYIYENEGLTSFSVFSVIVSGANVFCGVQTQGVFKRALSELGITNSAAIKESYASNILIYPNPVIENFIIEKEDFENTNVEILSLKGEIVQKLNLVAPKTTINVEALTNGVYLVKFSNDNGLTFSRFVKD